MCELSGAALIDNGTKFICDLFVNRVLKKSRQQINIYMLTKLLKKYNKKVKAIQLISTLTKISVL